jgi:hypothetical protein
MRVTVLALPSTSICSFTCPYPMICSFAVSPIGISNSATVLCSPMASLHALKCAEAPDSMIHRTPRGRSSLSPINDLSSSPFVPRPQHSHIHLRFWVPHRDHSRTSHGSCV